MRSEQRLVWLAMMTLLLAGSGCCCVQGMPSGCGPCGMSGLASCSSCSSGCGETYVDEWVSHPPTVDACCAGDCRPVRSLLRALWGSRFVNGCDMCDGGCDSGCDSGGCSSCGYASSGGSGCTSCGGGGMVSGGMVSGGGGGCTSCGGGGGAGVPTEAMMPSASRRMPSRANQLANDGEPRMVPGSYRISEPRRVNASVASERINPARQKIDAKRTSYAGE